jgi:hypothetical protein
VEPSTSTIREPRDQLHQLGLQRGRQDRPTRQEVPQRRQVVGSTVGAGRGQGIGQRARHRVADHQQRRRTVALDRAQQVLGIEVLGMVLDDDGPTGDPA